MKMKRYLIVPAFALGLCMAACSSGTNTSTETENDMVSEETEITAESAEDTDSVSGQVFSKMTKLTNEACQKLEDRVKELDETAGDSLESYTAASDEVSLWYEEVLEESESFFGSLYDLSKEYYQECAEIGIDEDGRWQSNLKAGYDSWKSEMNRYNLAMKTAGEDTFSSFEAAFANTELSESSPAYIQDYQKMYGIYSDGWDQIYDSYSAAVKLGEESYADLLEAFEQGNTDVDSVLENTARKLEEAGTETDDQTDSDAGSSAAVSVEADEEVSDDKPMIEADQQGVEYSEEAAPSTAETIDCDGLSDGFISLMSNYESFMEEYAAAWPNVDADMQQRYEDSMSSLKRIGVDGLNDQEQAYYLEVMERISKTLESAGVK